MNVFLKSVILFVQDVELLKGFYRQHFHFEVTEEIKDEWVVLGAGHCELALHKAGPVLDASVYPDAPETNNVKLIFETAADLRPLREELVRNGVFMREAKSFAGFPELLLYC